ncbi:MAG: hypothetical protein FHP93_20645, partial [Denitromonas halophila]
MSGERPPRSLRSRPPEGAATLLGAARRSVGPPRSLCSLPPGGAARRGDFCPHAHFARGGSALHRRPVRRAWRS